MKTFRGVLYSILSLALSGFFFYKIYSVRDVAPRLKIRITDNEAINAVIDTMMKFANLRGGIMMIILGILAMIFYTVFSYPLHVFFYDLPLSSKKVPDFFEEKLKPWSRMLSALYPALFVGLYMSVHLLLQYLLYEDSIYPQTLESFKRFWLPITVILVSVSLVKIAIKTVINGGVWGLIIRFPLVIVGNFTLSIVASVLAILSGVLIFKLLMAVIFVIAIIVMCIFTPKTKTEYVYRD